ncbi:GDSL-like Lipase/Acylhydrolase [Salegentibacter holothuriorum]|uniref:GDSL-like Lipase/Acylhydrolase n=1 Tax=Salegentibacter holothuriorum TaxID=241145 RepID=A0A1T5BGP9_9FLAO|nr:SGNH/GDSL hydrolase family protein [Salegentibacter holothuriorum]SKB46454.1 GDSL-like Lipase/Acylhydrolase [Salegentibacter holothuriorum]
MRHYFKYIAVVALGIVSCEPEFDNPVDEAGAYTNGEADFSRYVALGNSLTAGYADNALYITGQENAYPNILSQQFEKTQDVEEFTIPFMSDNAGGLLLGGNQITQNRLVLAVDANGDPSPRVYSGMQPTTEVGNVLQGPFSNMGVPGAKSYHLGFSGYGNIQNLATQSANPYFVRFASSPDATVMQDALAQNPTFFSLWIGNNDVLGYATSGGTGVDQTNNTDPTTYGDSDITDSNVFGSVYSQMVQSLAANASGGVLVNIPDVASVPFFTTVPIKAIPLDAATAGALNQQFSAYNTQVLPGLVQAGFITAEEAQARQINFAEGQNYVTLQDESLTNIGQAIQGEPFNLDPQTAALLSQLRQATPTDLIPLTSAGFLGTTVGDNPNMVNGVSVPLGDQHVLTNAEQALVRNATQKYNQVISGLAQANGLALVDANAMLKQLAEGGISFDGGTITSTFATGGAFSLDGIHLTPRGNAVMANEIIDAINSTYSASVPKVNVGTYSTVTASNEVQ